MSDERLESPTHVCHRCSRPITGDRRLCGSCAAGIPVCACGHSWALHDLRPNGTRTACSVTTGTGPCTCISFERSAA